jgi:hydroxyacyl-ACP dehydratase HTD2-like protein with hotdog domain
MLLPDGTDPLQSPGEPFVRRMWAGGTLLFNKNLSSELELNNRRAYCREHIPNISIKGSEGDERVFVNIERQIGYCGTTTENEWLLDGGTPRSAARNMPSMEAQVDFSPAIIETRNIVFMREKAIATIKEDVARRGKTLRRMSILDSLPWLLS